MPYVVAAPTGKAARNLTERTGIEARTVHGALGKSPDANFLDAVSWNCIGLVVVDEASMVSLEMLAGILNRVRRNCRVALLGDPNQLLSVGRKRPLRPSDARRPFYLLAAVVPSKHGCRGVASECRGLPEAERGARTAVG